MSDVGSPQAAAVSAAAETPPVVPDATKSEVQDATTNGTSNGDAVVNNSEVEAAVAKEVAADDEATPDTTTDKQTEDAPQDKSVTTQEDVEMKDVDNATDAVVPVADASAADAEGVNDTPALTKSKAGRRKSVGVPEHKNKKLNKKGSVAKITHLDAKPGDYFLARLKGFPPWPCIICSEDMLPTTLLKARPVTAAREDGSYLPPYADGGPKIKDRTFPIMYLATNEFGWHVNTELTDVDLDTIGDLPVPKKKDLKEAHSIAAEKHDLEFFKDMLIAHEESRKADEAAKEAAKEAKEAKKAAKEKRKSQVVVDEDEDVDMHDAAAEDEPAPEIAPKGKKQTKKRKAEEDANTPDRPESGKKPKVTIKVKSNGTETATPKSTKATKDKDASAKPKKSKKEVKETVEAPPKEPELTPEEKRVKKEKEILFLRHKLQKGLLTRDQKPKEEEMKAMSEFVTKLEGYAELEVSIIRATKINKVLKAILKLDSIPKEEEFQFKARSQTLLDKWNKLLANEQDAPAAAAPPAATNGVSDESKKVDTVKTDGGISNGVKESTEEGKIEAKQEEEKPETKVDEPALASETTPATTDPDPESKETPKIEETPTVEETAKTTEAIAETEA